MYVFKYTNQYLLVTLLLCGLLIHPDGLAAKATRKNESLMMRSRPDIDQPFGSKALIKKELPAAGSIRPRETKNRYQAVYDGWFSYDKGYHLLGSFMMTIAADKSLNQFTGTKEEQARVWAASFTFGFGLGKELFDATRPGNHFSWKDLLADLAGITLGLVLLNNE